MKILCRKRLLIFALAVAAMLVPWGITGVLAEAPSKEPSKIAYDVQQEIKRCEAATVAGVADFSSASGAAVRVSAPGEIELVFHATSATGPEEIRDLAALGAIIIDELKIPPELGLPPIGIIQAWVPFNKVEEAAALGWVATVTTPIYSESNPHPTNPTNGGKGTTSRVSVPGR